MWSRFHTLRISERNRQIYRSTNRNAIACQHWSAEEWKKSFAGVVRTLNRAPFGWLRPISPERCRPSTCSRVRNLVPISCSWRSFSSKIDFPNPKRYNGLRARRPMRLWTYNRTVLKNRCNINLKCACTVD